MEDDCRFVESFIKSRLSLRSMEWQLFAFVKIEEKLSPWPQPQHRTLNAEISKLMFLWVHSDKVTSLYKNQAFELAEWFDMADFDINPDDILVVNNYQSFACECSNYAPILPLEEMSRIEGIYGNVDNQNLYVQKSMRRFACS